MIFTACLVTVLWNSLANDLYQILIFHSQEISNFLTHYSGSPSLVIRSSASIPVATPSQHSYVGVASPAAENVQGTTPTERFSKALSINVLQEERVAAKVCGCGGRDVGVGCV